MKRDWRVILGTGVVVLIVIGSFMIGSYFGKSWRFQSDDERFKPPPPISNVPTPPPVRGNQLDSDPEIVIYDAEAALEATSAADASEREQRIRNSIALLRAGQLQVEAEIDQLTKLRNETNMEWARASERLGQELPAKQKALDIEVNRLQKIIEEKLSPNPTPEEYLAIEEWHQLRKLRRENDSVAAVLALENSYSQKMTEIDRKTDKWFEELSVIKGMIKDFALQLEAEGAGSD